MFRIEFYVDDKNLGEAFKRLAGIARNVQHVYIPNLESKANGRVHIKAKDTLEALAKEIHKRSLKEVTGPQMKEIVAKLGMNPTSYSHYVQGLVAAGFLKKGKIEGNAMNYIVTGK